jgi:SAM-dependent methyltransferase
MKTLISQDPLGGWEKAWAQEITPWDGGSSQPPLRDVITSSGIPFPRSGRALVPGCGRGYDAVLIAQTLGLDTVAVDISQTAVNKANLFLESVKLENGKVSAQLADFFTYEVGDADRFSLVYDYTYADLASLFYSVSPLTEIICQFLCSYSSRPASGMG